MGLALLPNQSICGQNKINSTVEVKKSYDAKLLRISKSKIDTKYADSLLNLNLNFDYLSLNRPYKDLYDFTPMSSMDIKKQGSYTPPLFYAKAGIGFQLNPVVDLFFNPNIGSKFSLLLSLKHDSFWGTRPLSSGTMGHGDEMNNDFNLKLGYAWESGQLTLNGGYSYDYYSYFANNNGKKTRKYFRDSLSHVYNVVNADFNIKSTNSSASSFYYDITARYLRSADNAKIKYLTDFENTPSVVENTIEADVKLGGIINKRHKIFVDAKSTTLIYTDAFSAMKGIFEISPNYIYDFNRFKLVAGVTFANYYSSDKESYPIDLASVYPNISLTYETVKQRLWLFASVDGENKFNSLNSVMRDNHWVSPIYKLDLLNTAIPIRAIFGINGRVGGKFGYSLSGGYYAVRNLLTFVIDPALPVQVTKYYNSSVFGVDAALRWKSTDFVSKIEAKYHHYVDGTPYMIPEFEGKFYAQYNYRKRFFAGVDCFYRTSVLSQSKFGEDYLINGSVELNFTLSYAFNSNLLFFLEGKNLLNQRIQYYQNYFNPGINFGVGVCLKF